MHTYLLISYLYTYLLTYSMEQSPSWEANWFAASQEILRILWNPKVHYRIHKCPPPVPILSQIDPVNTPKSHFLNIHLIIILPFAPGSPKWPLSLTFPHQNPEYFSPIPNLCCFNETSFCCSIWQSVFAERPQKKSKNLTIFFFVWYMWRSGVTDPSIPGFRTGMRAVVGFIRQLLYPQGYSHQYRSHRNMGGSHSLSGSRGKYRNICQCRETNSNPLIVHRRV